MRILRTQTSSPSGQPRAPTASRISTTAATHAAAAAAAAAAKENTAKRLLGINFPSAMIG
jgi:hypothetical protein